VVENRDLKFKEFGSGKDGYKDKVVVVGKSKSSIQQHMLWSKPRSIFEGLRIWGEKLESVGSKASPD